MKNREILAGEADLRPGAGLGKGLLCYDSIELYNLHSL